jgi:hypothetical protein
MVTDIRRRCNSCSSKDLGEFRGEFAIQVAAIEGLSTAIVWVFPGISVCLTCGVAQFHVPHREMRVLKTGLPVDGAPILIENSEDQNGAGSVVDDGAAGLRRIQL